MNGYDGIIVIVLVSAAAILIFRLIGAWMLRINEIINLQKEILKELKKSNPE